MEGINSLVFTYLDPQDKIGECRKYPFRVGDVVRVYNWGDAYSGWFDANTHFLNTVESPYYNRFARERNLNTLFKIKAMARHKFGFSVVCYLEDRNKRGLIIDARGLGIVRQYPLKKGEKKMIKLDIID